MLQDGQIEYRGQSYGSSESFKHENKSKIGYKFQNSDAIHFVGRIFSKYNYSESGKYEQIDEGWFENDEKDGYRRIIYQDTSYYIGHIKDNKRHGQGKFTSATGEVYDGNWDQDQFVE